MITKYVVVMTHTPAIGNSSTYYYKGQNKSGEHCFGFHRSTAQRFDVEEEATHTLTILKAIDFCARDSYSVLPVKCCM